MSSTPPCSPIAACAGGCSPCWARRSPWADHLVVHPQSWKLLRGKVTLPTRDQLRATFNACLNFEDESQGRDVGGVGLGRVAIAQRVSRPTCWCWPHSTWPRRSRTSRCCPSPLVAAHLSDLADAALAAALRVAEITVCGNRDTTAAGGHRDGQMRCPGTELRQRRRRHLRRRARRRPQHPRGRRDDEGGLGGVLPGGRRAAAGGPQR